MENVIVVKIGGSTLGSHDTTIEDLVELQKRLQPVIVVHGGGALITDWLKKQGVPSTFVQGERVTDGPSLEVVTAVLAGLVNKEITSGINVRGGCAVGISGVDGAIIEGKITNKDRGYVGGVVQVNTALLETLVDSGFIPIVAPVGLNSFDRPVDAPATLNYNADTIAGEIAAAVKAERLIFLTDVAGILDKGGKLIPSMNPVEAEDLIKSGVASGGMIPKIRACVKALSGKSTNCIIDGREPHALIHEIESTSGGTTIVRASR